MEECKHATWLSGLLDEELTEDQQRQLCQHLEQCAPCRELLRELKAMERELGTVAAPCPAVWEGLWQTVAQRIAGEAEVRPRWSVGVLCRLSRLRQWCVKSRPALALAVAAGILALLAGVWALMSILPGAKPGPSGLGPKPVALAPADALDVEIEQSEGEPGALLLVSADGKVAVVWVMSDQPTQAAPGS